MKILVTGSAGFIGSALSIKLLERGDIVVGIDNLNDYYDPRLKQARLARLQTEPGFTFVAMDFADRAAVARLPEKFPDLDQILHLGAQATDPKTA